MITRRDARRPSDNLVRNEPVDLNTATFAELDAVPGIGDARAAQIIAWREARGSFEAVEDLQHVPEVGPEVMREVRACFKV